MAKMLNNLSGKQFGDWFVLDDHITVNTRTKWKTRCKCGFEKYTFAIHLVKGTSKMCQKCASILYSKFKNKTISDTFFNKIKKCAQTRDIEFKITKEYIWDLYLKQKQKCPYTNLIIKLPSQSKYNDGLASLDRIDSSKGYIEGNVQWVHKTINVMKWTLSEEEFISFCKLVANNKKCHKPPIFTWT